MRYNKILITMFFFCVDTSYSKRTLNKPFSHYDKLSYVFEKDHATGAHVEMFTDIRSNMEGPNDSVQVEDGLDTKFLTMCTPRWTCHPMTWWPIDRIGPVIVGRVLAIKRGSTTCKHSRIMTSFRTSWKVQMINLGPLPNGQIELAKIKTYYTGSHYTYVVHFGS